MENRRILGKTELILQDSSTVEATVYGIGHYEKSQIINRNTKDVFKDGHHYTVRDTTSIMDEILKIAFEDIDFNLLPDNAVDIYQEYIDPKKHEKKEKTSEDGQTDTE